MNLHLYGFELDRLIDEGTTISQLMARLSGSVVLSASDSSDFHARKDNKTGDMEFVPRGRLLIEPRAVDPHTAYANWAYGVVAGDPRGEHSVGRVVYWYDPDGDVSFRDEEMRDAWPELQSEWDALKHAAYVRCQKAGAPGDPP
jgi:hypothetical protein